MKFLAIIAITLTSPQTGEVVYNKAHSIESSVRFVSVEDCVSHYTEVGTKAVTIFMSGLNKPVKVKLAISCKESNHEIEAEKLPRRKFAGLYR